MFKPYKISNFKKAYPMLYAHFSFQTEREFERANMDWIKKQAEKCDYEAAVKLVYLDVKAIRLPIIIDKRCVLVEHHRKTRGKGKLVKYLTRFEKAERNVYPFPGRRNKITPEAPLLTKEYIYTIIEIQELKEQIDCAKKNKIKIFNRDSEFWEAVKQIKLKVYRESPDWNSVDDKKIIEIAEQLLIDDICSKNVFLVARFILAEEYSVQYETIYDNLLPIHKKLKEIYSNIPRSETFINDLINKGIEKKLKKNNFKKE
jgi:hypothetical protein